MDAALAASATLLISEPHMTGIGGDCFAIVAEPSGQIHGLNGSGRSPAKAELGWYLENGFTEIPVASPHAVTVPAALRAWEKLHQKFGSMDWTRLFSDAVDLAAGGVPIAPRVARDWALLEEKLAAHAGGRKHLLFDGKAPPAGKRIFFPALGKTIERIAREGVDVFYEGEIAREIAVTVQTVGGFLSEEDLANCEVDWVQPVSTVFRGHEILELPPNGQGVTALTLLNMLERSPAMNDPISTERFHRSIEFARIAYALRDTCIGDPDHMTANIETLLSSEVAEALLKQFHPERRNEQIRLPDVAGSNTIYVAVVDPSGMAVSFINSVFSGFGTGITTPETGITLQNRGSGFVVKEGHPNAIGPSKRPLHTIIPSMILRQSKPVGVFGVMGGAYQSAGHAHVLENLFDFRMDPQAAIDFTRIFFDPRGNILAETGMPQPVFDALSEMGHPMQRGGLHGGGQIIWIDSDTGVLIAGSDPRKDGQAVGF